MDEGDATDPELTARTRRRQHLSAALRDVATVGPGMFFLGVTFGLLVVQTGFAWWWAPLFSGLIFGGSVEFLLVAMIAAAAPLASIALTTLLVQGRHVFYALSFPLHRIRGRVRRGYAMFALIDEAYALTSGRGGAELAGTRILVTQLGMHLCWVGGGVAGALAGAGWSLHLPALEFVFTALFVVLAIEASLAGGRYREPVMALACALLALAVAPGQMLLVAMVGYCGLLVVTRARTKETRHA